MLMLHAAPSRAAMLAMNRSWAVLAISGFGTALFVAVAAYAVPRYGPIGGNMAHVMLGVVTAVMLDVAWLRSEEHTSELQSLMRNSYAVFCLKNKKQENSIITDNQN